MKKEDMKKLVGKCLQYKAKNGYTVSFTAYDFGTKTRRFLFDFPNYEQFNRRGPYFSLTQVATAIEGKPTKVKSKDFLILGADMKWVTLDKYLYVDIKDDGKIFLHSCNHLPEHLKPIAKLMLKFLAMTENKECDVLLFYGIMRTLGANFEERNLIATRMFQDRVIKKDFDTIYYTPEEVVR